MDFNVFFSLLPLLWGLHFSTGYPLAGAAVTSSPGSSASQVSSSIARRLSRTKRCSCSSFLDKECIYFCHLDIIWINTPERVVPYGLGSVPRAKRSLKENLSALGRRGRRCECGSRDDSVCYQFCEDEQQTPRFSVKVKVQKQNTVEASDRTDHNKPKCTGLKCVYHLLNTIKRLESANSKHLPTSMKWIYRIRKVRQDSHDKLKRFPVSMASPVAQCRDCKR